MDKINIAHPLLWINVREDPFLLYIRKTVNWSVEIADFYKLQTTESMMCVIAAYILHHSLFNPGTCSVGQLLGQAISAMLASDWS